MLLFQYTLASIFIFFSCADFFSRRVDNKGFVTLDDDEMKIFKVVTIPFLLGFGAIIFLTIPIFLDFPFSNIIKNISEDSKVYEVLWSCVPILFLFVFLFFFSFLFFYTILWTRWLFKMSRGDNYRFKLLNKESIIGAFSISLVLLVLLSPFKIIDSLQVIITALMAVSLYSLLKRE